MDNKENHDWHQCDICGQHATSEPQLAAHRYTHTFDNPFSCCICYNYKSYTSKRELDNHMLNTHFIKCATCPSEFSTAGGLETHKLTHIVKKPFKCDNCPLGFARKGSLVLHKRVHNENKTYECDVCQERFPAIDKLVAHKRIHAKKTYECDVCNKRFESSGKLKLHKLVHTGNKTYNCYECGISFPTDIQSFFHTLYTHTIHLDLELHNRLFPDD